jgi:hypothetical protein
VHVLTCIALPCPPADVLNKLRQKHAAKDGSGRNYGIDVNTGEGGDSGQPGRAWLWYAQWKTLPVECCCRCLKAQAGQHG